MSFVYECNKNNRDDTKRDESAWHNKILTNRLRFICLLDNVNDIAETRIFRARKVRRIGQTLRFGVIKNYTLYEVLNKYHYIYI